MHPLDAKGKTPRNLEHGILSAGASSDLSGRRVIAFSPGEKWERLKSAPKEAFNNALTPTAPPVRVSRTVLEGNGSARVVSTGKDSSIVYDPKEHRFVNSNNNSAAASSEKVARGESEKVPAAGRANRDGNATVAAAPPARTVTPPRSVAPPRNSVPPPVPRYSGGGERSSVGGASGGSWGGSRSSGASGGIRCSTPTTSRARSRGRPRRARLARRARPSRPRAGAARFAAAPRRSCVPGARGVGCGDACA